jgi:hypothetical protein
MASQKLENLLNLALSVSEDVRLKSGQLNVGYMEEEKRWELIVKYNGDLGRLNGEVIQVEELIAGYAIVTLPENLIETFARLDEVEYVEKPKRLYFSVLSGKEASCIRPVSVRSPYLSGKGVLVGVIDSGACALLLSEIPGFHFYADMGIKIHANFDASFTLTVMHLLC